jgi:Clp amino terminal domain, pathogenicity island component/NTF2 fold immunity protein
MFERYSERARRAIFFARYEASQFGSTIIEPEHLLLGVLREDKNVAARFSREMFFSGESLREDITRRLTIRERVSTSHDLPLSEVCKRILVSAAEEAEKMNHRNVSPEHLLLGILREKTCMAAQVLAHYGLKVDAVRQELARGAVPEEAGTVSQEFRPLFSILQHHPVLPKPGVVPDADTAKSIAEAIWIPIYGAETIASQMPLRAELKFNVWIVTGSAAPEDVLFAFILQADGRILSVGRGPANV